MVTSHRHSDSKISGSQQTVVLQIWQEKKTKKLTCMSFLCMIALRNKIITHTFLPSFDNTNSRLCQERLRTLRSNNGDVHENFAEKLAPRPFKSFRDYPKSPSYLKQGNLWWSWREGPHPSSGRDGRIYRLAVAVLKKLRKFGHFTS